MLWHSRGQTELHRQTTMTKAHSLCGWFTKKAEQEQPLFFLLLLIFFLLLSLSSCFFFSFYKQLGSRHKADKPSTRDARTPPRQPELWQNRPFRAKLHLREQRARHRNGVLSSRLLCEECPEKHQFSTEGTFRGGHPRSRRATDPAAVS